MERKRVTLVKHAADFCLTCNVAIDEKKCRPHVFACEHVEQIAGRSRVRTIVIREVDRGRCSLWHVPHRSTTGKGVEQKGAGAVRRSAAAASRQPRSAA